MIGRGRGLKPSIAWLRRRYGKCACKLHTSAELEAEPDVLEPWMRSRFDSEFAELMLSSPFKASDYVVVSDAREERFDGGAVHLRVWALHEGAVPK